MSLSIKEKELISVGSSVAAGCVLCTNHHFKKVKRAGAADEEIREAITLALAERDRASVIMERQGLKLLGVRIGSPPHVEEEARPDLNDTSRMKELISLASAVALNCTSSTKRHLATARELGVDEEEIESTFHVSKFIKGNADSHCCSVL